MRSSAIPAILLLLLGCGPLGPMPGGELSGELVGASGPLGCDAHTIQLETNPADPYSVNTWCLGHDGDVFIPTSLILGAENPLDRQWVKNVLEDPRVRLRIDGKIYERKALRVTDPAQLEKTRDLLLDKYEADKDEHTEAAWVFRMVPR